MTTTELIELLAQNEKGGISRKSRKISLTINGKYMPDPQITISSTGDGICGAEIDLDVDGEFFEDQEPKTEWIPATTPPTRNDRYLVTRECLGKTFVDIVSYATNLYEVNKYEFYDKKNKCGWWKSDSECGSYEINGIAGWQELPESYKESEVEI